MMITASPVAPSDCVEAWTRRLIELCAVYEATGDESSFHSVVEPHLLAAFEAGSDELIAAACRVQLGDRIGLAVRRCAETMAERIELPEGDHRAAYGVFAVPVLFTLGMDTPESQLDWALSGALQGVDLRRDFEAPEGAAPTMIAPHVHRFADLTRPSLRSLRRQVLEMALAARAGSPGAARPFQVLPASKRRAGIFLRFVIGTIEHQLADRRPQPATRWDFLEASLSDGLARRLRTNVEVWTRFDATFHHALYEGMWAYQSARLQHIARSALGQSSESEAIVHVPEPAPSNRIRVGLRSARGGPILDSYLLQFRPGQPAATAFCCVTEGLRAGGLTNVQAGTARHFVSAAQQLRAAMPI